MKRHPATAAFALVFSAFVGLAHAQTGTLSGTPSPSGPPSTQPLPKSPSQPLSEPGAAEGGPQITLPLRRPVKDPATPIDASQPPKLSKAQALQNCKSATSRKARLECRQQVERDFAPAIKP